MAAASLSCQLGSIDWAAPWWQPWRSMGQCVSAYVASGMPLCDALNTQATTAIKFVPQTCLPEGQAYEAFIFSTGLVPTRENLHDFFNGLAWLVFPHTKRRLNQLQAGEIQASGVHTTRGPLRDALTLFDENAALWPLAHGATCPVLDALRAKDWLHACVTLRSQWPANAPVLFGHALLEKLVSPYKSITAHVFTAQPAINYVAQGCLDATVAQLLEPGNLVPKPFIPLPVLGVPHWWAANAQVDFYSDAQVFRSAQLSLPK